MTEHDTLTDADKAELLKMAGITPEQAQAFNTPTVVAEVVTMPRKRKALMTQDVADTLPPALVDEDRITESSKIAKELLGKAKGNLDTAKQLSENWAKAEFDKVKLSKIQAAALGVDKSAHNKSEWQRIQQMREKINTDMRRSARGHVRTKISEAKKAQSPELDALLLQYADHPLARALTQLTQPQAE